MTKPSDRRSGSATHLGRNPARKTNQDRLKICDPVSSTCPDALYIVCDGMGGHKAGEVASQVAVDEISRVYAELACQHPIPDVLAQAIQQAHAAVRQRSADDALGDMGTTVVVAVVHDNELHVANVGDSRAYLLRDGTLMQVSRDHSRVAEMVRAGVLTPEEAKTSSVRNVITRAMSSMRMEVEPEFFQEEFREGDVLVMCTDGLWGPVEDPQIQATVATLPPQTAAETLVNLANEAGGPDNVSVIVVARGPMPTVIPVLAAAAAVAPTEEFKTVRMQPLKPRPASRRPLVLALLLATLAILGVVAVGVGAVAYFFLGGSLQLRPTASATYTRTPMRPTMAPTLPPTLTPIVLATDTYTPLPPTASFTPTVTPTATATATPTPTHTRIPLPTKTRVPLPTATLTPLVPTVAAETETPTSATPAP
jgi:PPM family protein phosphatase